MPLNPPISSHNKKTVARIAESAFAYTVSKIRGASILLSAEERNTPEGMAISRQTNLMRAENIPGAFYSREWIEAVAAAAEKYAVGNCCERACVAFNFLLNSGEDTPIELFNNPFQDHIFVVIGRSESTNPADPRSWNKDTIICDTLLEDSCYTLAEVNFDDLSTCAYPAIAGLWSKRANAIMMQKDILAKANGHVDGPRIISQDVMVLRSRANPISGQFTTYNAEVQICYEKWDFPTKRDYKKHQDKNSAHSLCHGIASFYQPTTAEVPVKLTPSLGTENAC